jgi:hypothetical protein
MVTLRDNKFCKSGWERQAESSELADGVEAQTRAIGKAKGLADATQSQDQSLDVKQTSRLDSGSFNYGDGI